MEKRRLKQLIADIEKFELTPEEKLHLLSDSDSCPAAIHTTK